MRDVFTTDNNLVQPSQAQARGPVPAASGANLPKRPAPNIFLHLSVSILRRPGSAKGISAPHGPRSFRQGEGPGAPHRKSRRRERKSD